MMQKLKNWHGEFDELWPKHSKISKNLHFNGLLLTKLCIVWAKKKYRGVTFMALNIDAKFERKMICAFKYGIRNWANFHQNMFGSLNIGTLIGSFYPRQKMHELKIYRGVLCHDNEEWCKTWTGIDLLVQN